MFFKNHGAITKSAAYSSARFINTICNMSEYRSRNCEFEPQSGHITSVEIDHEIISTPILLIKERQRKYMHSVLVYSVLVDCFVGSKVCPRIV